MSLPLIYFNSSLKTFCGIFPFLLLRTGDISVVCFSTSRKKKSLKFYLTVLANLGINHHRKKLNLFPGGFRNTKLKGAWNALKSSINWPPDSVLQESIGHDQ